MMPFGKMLYDNNLPHASFGPQNTRNIKPALCRLDGMSARPEAIRKVLLLVTSINSSILPSSRIKRGHPFIERVRHVERIRARICRHRAHVLLVEHTKQMASAVIQGHPRAKTLDALSSTNLACLYRAFFGQSVRRTPSILFGYVRVRDSVQITLRVDCIYHRSDVVSTVLS